MANLAAAFASLPETIKDWISSSDTTGLIIGIGGEFGLSEDQSSVVSRQIMRLITGDLEPRDFISELASSLDIDGEKAKNIVGKVIELILNPISEPLKKSGVDIGLITGYPRQAPSHPPSASAPENLPVAAPKPEPSAPSQPLVIHMEEENADQSDSAVKPSFRYHSPSPLNEERPPVKTEIEGLRVVHYSEFMTKLNQANVARTKIPVPKSKWFLQ